MLELISHRLVHPLWAKWEGSRRMQRLQELEREQWLPTKLLRQQQQARLEALLRFAGQHSPYYRRLFHSHEFDCTSPFDLVTFQRLPLTTKADLQKQGAQFLADNDAGQSPLIKAKTGGSTGRALTVYFDDACQQMRNAAAMRSDRWAKRNPGSKTAALWGNPVLPHGVKSKIRSRLLERLFYLDTMKLDAGSVAQFVEDWAREDGKIIFGHAHSIYTLAGLLREQGIDWIRPQGIISTSMMLAAHERQCIEQVFACPVTDRYGCEEVGLIASQCEQHGAMHLNIDDLYIEFLDEQGNPVPAGTMGRIVVTDLNNYGMPLIRYSVEDWGVPSDERCPCGRGLPLMSKLIGRSADFLQTVDGSKVAGISLIERTLTAVPGIVQMQLIQHALRRFTVNLVTSDVFEKEHEQALRKELMIVFGQEASFSLQFMPTIPCEANGKFRFSICEL